jgi:hypothetical protein
MILECLHHKRKQNMQVLITLALKQCITPCPNNESKKLLWIFVNTNLVACTMKSFTAMCYIPFMSLLHHEGGLLVLYSNIRVEYKWIKGAETLGFLKLIIIYVVKTSSSFHIDFQETLRFNPASFADASDFIKRADNALRTVQPFSFPLSIQDSLSRSSAFKSVCVKHFTLERRREIRTALKFKCFIM